MKIKNSNPSLKSGILSVVFVALCVVCTALRTYQMFSFIEPVTGFNVGPEWFMILLYVLLIGGCLAFCVVSFLSKDTAELQPMGTKSKTAAYLAFLMSLLFMRNWFSNVFGGVDTLTGAQSTAGFKGMMASGLLTGSLQGVFAFFSMVYMFIFAFDMKNGTAKASKFKILAIAPAGWAAVRLVGNFLSQISFLEVSDLFLELVMLSFMALFFMAFAQVNSGVNSTGFSWRLCGFGYSAALVAVPLFVSRIAISLTRGSGELNPSLLANFTDFVFAFFVVVLVMKMLKKDSVSEEV